MSKGNDNNDNNHNLDFDNQFEQYQYYAIPKEQILYLTYTHKMRISGDIGMKMRMKRATISFTVIKFYINGNLKVIHGQLSKEQILRKVEIIVDGINPRIMTNSSKRIQLGFSMHSSNCYYN